MNCAARERERENESEKKDPRLLPPDQRKRENRFSLLKQACLCARVLGRVDRQREEVVSRIGKEEERMTILSVSDADAPLLLHE